MCVRWGVPAVRMRPMGTTHGSRHTTLDTAMHAPMHAGSTAADARPRPRCTEPVIGALHVAMVQCTRGGPPDVCRRSGVGEGVHMNGGGRARGCHRGIHRDTDCHVTMPRLRDSFLHRALASHRESAHQQHTCLQRRWRAHSKHIHWTVCNCVAGEHTLWGAGWPRPDSVKLSSPT